MEASVFSMSTRRMSRSPGSHLSKSTTKTPNRALRISQTTPPQQSRLARSPSGTWTTSSTPGSLSALSSWPRLSPAKGRQQPPLWVPCAPVGLCRLQSCDILTYSQLRTPTRTASIHNIFKIRNVDANLHTLDCEACLTD